MKSRGTPATRLSCSKVCFTRILQKEILSAKYSNSLNISTSKQKVYLYQLSKSTLNTSKEEKVTAAGNKVEVITMSLDTTYLNMQ